MSNQRLLFALSVLNLALLAFQLGQMRHVEASDAAPVLRGRALEIVDGQGRIRASIKLHAAADSYPETVMLRLVDQNGRPEVKLGASDQGGGLGLVGATDTVQVLLKAEGSETSLKLTHPDGRQHLVKP